MHRTPFNFTYPIILLPDRRFDNLIGFDNQNINGFTLHYLNLKQYSIDYAVYKELLEIDQRIGWLSKEVLVYSIFTFCAETRCLASNGSKTNFRNSTQF